MDIFVQERMSTREGCGLGVHVLPLQNALLLEPEQPINFVSLLVVVAVLKLLSPILPTYTIQQIHSRILRKLGPVVDFILKG